MGKAHVKLGAVQEDIHLHPVPMCKTKAFAVE